MDLSKRIAKKMIELAAFVDDGIYMDAAGNMLKVGDKVLVVSGRQFKGQTGTIKRLMWLGKSFGKSGKNAEVWTSATSLFDIEPTYLKKI
jgi:phage-related minor tail protein